MYTEIRVMNERDLVSRRQTIYYYIIVDGERHMISQPYKDLQNHKVLNLRLSTFIKNNFGNFPILHELI